MFYYCLSVELQRSMLPIMARAKVLRDYTSTTSTHVNLQREDVVAIISKDEDNTGLWYGAVIVRDSHNGRAKLGKVWIISQYSNTVV